MSYGREQDPKRRAPGMPTPPPNLRPGGAKPLVKPPTVKKTLPAGESSQTPRPHAPVPPPDEDEYAIRPTDEYAIRPEPVAPPVPIPVPRVREPVVTQDPVPEPPALPFWTGVFSFPFYSQSLGAWMLISLGLTLGAEGIVLCLWTLDHVALAFRCIVMPVFLIIAFTCSYGSAACKAITQATADGYDVVDDWPTGDWREWAWTMTYPVAMFIVAALLGGGAQWLLSLMPTREGHAGLAQMTGLPIPALFVIFVAYPVLFLSALEAGSATTPVSLPVLRSLNRVWWAWALFYLESGVLFGAWLTLVVLGYLVNPWLTAAVGAPLAAALAMIYARLLGRLAWCIDRHLGPRGGDEDI